MLELQSFLQSALEGVRDRGWEDKYGDLLPVIDKQGRDGGGIGR